MFSFSKFFLIPISPIGFLRRWLRRLSYSESAWILDMGVFLYYRYEIVPQGDNNSQGKPLLQFAKAMERSSVAY